MNYVVLEKRQKAIDPHWGGGTRYALVLSSKYPKGGGKDDHMQSDIVVSKETFDGFEIGDTVSMSFRLVTE